VIEQIGLALFGVGAVWLSQSKAPWARKWAPMVGLAGQPFWFIAAWGQPGMLFVVCLYTYCWAQGIYNQWIR
jgi:hypothetical protein